MSKYIVTKITDEANNGDWRIKDTTDNTLIKDGNGMEISFPTYELAYHLAEKLNAGNNKRYNIKNMDDSVNIFITDLEQAIELCDLLYENTSINTYVDDTEYDKVIYVRNGEEE